MTSLGQRDTVAAVRANGPRALASRAVSGQYEAVDLDLAHPYAADEFAGAVLAELRTRGYAASRFDDTGFAGWHHRRFGGSRVAWDVRPVHLHYRVADVVS